eukprot:CAMPEP_0178400712 /NCGR_PEP_ID=MMETSP0689_2-20121128/15930_1 /TAXON_ID=160604 /ORGANISM="Amphidinium massartii, Strain CS-259" /LENGTH=50 /DNA_ID=CAMNT_0020021515 /DNA_START=123 /DNA_END=272 /DNA_ORIENTATION=-
MRMPCLLWEGFLETEEHEAKDNAPDDGEGRSEHHWLDLILVGAVDAGMSW